MSSYLFEITLVKDVPSHSKCSLRNGNLLKSHVSEICVKQILVNQEVGVLQKETNEFDFTTMLPQVDLFSFGFWRKLKTPKRHFEII